MPANVVSGGCLKHVGYQKVVSGRSIRSWRVSKTVNSLSKKRYDTRLRSHYSIGFAISIAMLDG